MYMCLSTAIKQSILKTQSRVLTDYLMAANMPSIKQLIASTHVDRMIVYKRFSQAILIWASDLVQIHWLNLLQTATTHTCCHSEEREQLGRDLMDIPTTIPQNEKQH